MGIPTKHTRRWKGTFPKKWSTPRVRDAQKGSKLGDLIWFHPGSGFGSQNLHQLQGPGVLKWVRVWLLCHRNKKQMKRMTMKTLYDNKNKGFMSIGISISIFVCLFHLHPCREGSPPKPAELKTLVNVSSLYWKPLFEALSKDRQCPDLVSLPKTLHIPDWFSFETDFYLLLTQFWKENVP